MVKNILIVDDSLEIQMLLRVLLESKGYQIDCRSNGEEALDFLASRQKPTDLILLDLQMPIMDGLTFLFQRKELPVIKDIPVILMSGDEAIHKTGRIENIKTVIKKPLSMASILQALETF